MEDFMMVEKVVVRQRLALYEQQIKEERQKIENEIKQMDDTCATDDIKNIWRASTKYSALRSRWSTLTEVLWGIQDIRCDEMFED